VKARAALLFVFLMLAGCGGRAGENQRAEGSTTPPYVRDESDPSLLNSAEQPVRVGELGPNFRACNARGAVRDRGPQEPVPVRAAPYEAAGEIDRIGQGAEFFICSRTQDQRWFGIVYDENKRASERCGVDGPIAERRDYRGPCAAGWVQSARVRLISGVPHEVPAAPATPNP
jgi:hypothetical protein